MSEYPGRGQDLNKLTARGGHAHVEALKKTSSRLGAAGFEKIQSTIDRVAGSGTSEAIDPAFQARIDSAEMQGYRIEIVDGVEIWVLK